MKKFLMDRDEIGKRAVGGTLPDGTWAMWVPVKGRIELFTKEKDERDATKIGNTAISMRCVPLAEDGKLETAVSRFGVVHRLWLPFQNGETLEDGTTLKYPNHKAPNTGSLVVEFVEATELTKLPARSLKTPLGWTIDGAPATINDGNARKALRAQLACDAILDLLPEGPDDRDGIEAMNNILSRFAFYAQSEVDDRGYGSLRNLRSALPVDATYGPIAD